MHENYCFSKIQEVSDEFVSVCLTHQLTTISLFNPIPTELKFDPEGRDQALISGVI